MLGGGCHVHIELDNTDGAACYNVLRRSTASPSKAPSGSSAERSEAATVFAARLGPYAREYWVVSSNATRDQFLELARQAYAGRNTVGFSYDDAESATSPSARSSSGEPSTIVRRFSPGTGSTTEA